MTSEMQPGVRAATPDGASPLQLLLPAGVVGVNDFATPQWWAGCEEQLATAGIVRTEKEYAPGRRATVLSVPRPAVGVPVLPDGDRILGVVAPVSEWLGDGTLGERLNRLARWREGLLSWAGHGRVVVLATERAPEEVAALAAGAAGIRWPLLDLAGRYTRRVEAAAGTDQDAIDPALGPTGDPRTPVAAAYADAMAAHVGELRLAGWISRDLAIADAVEAVSLGSEATSLPAAEADRLRTATVDALQDLRTAGVTFCGSRSLLRWPHPVDGDSLALDVAADAVLAVIEAAPERVDTVRLGLEPGLDEINELDARLRERRRELAAAAAGAERLDRLSKRQLFRRVVGRKRG